MTWPAVDALKQQIPLLDYLQSQNWKPARRISRGRLMGLCPLHADHQPSFLVDPAKICSTAMAADVAAISFASSSSTSPWDSETRWHCSGAPPDADLC